MLNIKTKFLLGIMTVAIMFVGAFALTQTANAVEPQAIVSASDIQYAATVQSGSSGQASLIWQKFLNGYSTANLVQDGKFGPLSVAAAKVWQASKGLAADGVLGPMSRAAAMAQISSGGPAVGFPAGCTSALGYSTVTGLACAGAALPTGCTSTVGYSPLTGAKCDGAGGGSTGPLMGGAGDSEYSHYATGEKNSVKEGEEDVKVLGFKIEAIDSDIEVSNVKVEISNTNYDGTVGDVSSENVSKYIDSVDIYKGTTKVGSEDLSDFTRTTASPDVYSKTMSLSNAVVKEGDKDPFYVMFNVNSEIDSDNMDAELKVELISYRFKDATGVVFTTTTEADDVTNDVTLDDASVDDQIDLKSSTNNPDDVTVEVSENDISDDFLALAFKLDVDDDSSDVTITELPIVLTFAGAGASVTSPDSIIDSVEVKFNGGSFIAEVDEDATLTAGAGSVTYTVDLLDEDVVLSGGDIEEGKVYITFAELEDNYAEDTTVEASISKAGISAETEADDSLTVTGSTTITGGTLTLSTQSAGISAHKWTVASAGTYIDYFFTVAADGADFDVLASSITDTAVGTATITNTSDTPETTTLGILSKYSGDSVVAISTTGFTVPDGSTTTFRVRYNLTTGTNGLWKEVTITSVAGQSTPDSVEVSPTATVNVN